MSKVVLRQKYFVLKNRKSIKNNVIAIVYLILCQYVTLINLQHNLYFMRNKQYKDFPKTLLHTKIIFQRE